MCRARLPRGVQRFPRDNNVRNTAMMNAGALPALPRAAAAAAAGSGSAANTPAGALVDIDDSRLLRRLMTEPPRLPSPRPAPFQCVSPNPSFAARPDEDEGYAADCDDPYFGGRGGGGTTSAENNKTASESPPTSSLSEDFHPRSIRPLAIARPPHARQIVSSTSARSSKSSGIFPNVPRHGKSGKRQREERERFERDRAESFAALGTQRLDRSIFEWARHLQAKRARMEATADNKNATFPTYVDVPQSQKPAEASGLTKPREQPPLERQPQHQPPPRVVTNAAFPSAQRLAMAAAAEAVAASAARPTCGTCFVPGFGFVFGGSDLALRRRGAPCGGPDAATASSLAVPSLPVNSGGLAGGGPPFPLSVAGKQTEESHTPTQLGRLPAPSVLVPPGA